MIEESRKAIKTNENNFFMRFPMPIIIILRKLFLNRWNFDKKFSVIAIHLILWAFFNRFEMTEGMILDLKLYLLLSIKLTYIHDAANGQFHLQ